MKVSWGRLTDETSHAYLSFTEYRDMGPMRSIEKVGKKLGKNPVALARHSAKYRWVERARDYDVYMSQRKAEALAETFAEMSKRHIWQIRGYQDTLFRFIEELDRLITDDRLDTESLFKVIMQFPKLYREATMIEHMVLGLEKEKAESLLSQDDDTRVVRQCNESQPSVEKTTAGTVEGEVSAPRNIIHMNSSGRIIEMPDEEKETPRKRPRLSRRQPGSQGSGARS